MDADCFSGISSSTHASTGYLRPVDDALRIVRESCASSESGPDADPAGGSSDSSSRSLGFVLPTMWRATTWTHRLESRNSSQHEFAEASVLNSAVYVSANAVPALSHPNRTAESVRLQVTAWLSLGESAKASGAGPLTNATVTPSGVLEEVWLEKSILEDLPSFAKSNPPGDPLAAHGSLAADGSPDNSPQDLDFVLPTMQRAARELGEAIVHALYFLILLPEILCVAAWTVVIPLRLAIRRWGKNGSRKRRKPSEMQWLVCVAYLLLATSLVPAVRATQARRPPPRDSPEPLL